MRMLVCLLLLMAMPTLTERATAQEAVTDTTVYEVVEKWPEYPGGWKVLVKDVRAYADGFWKRKYPKGRPMQRYESIHCRVVVSFIINENGEVTNPTIRRSVDKELDKEAILFAKSMPHWIPGEHKGRKVKVKFTLPIQF